MLRAQSLALLLAHSVQSAHLWLVRDRCKIRERIVHALPLVLGHTRHLPGHVLLSEQKQPCAGDTANKCHKALPGVRTQHRLAGLACLGVLRKSDDCLEL